MESLGAKLKAARELKGCTYEQVSRDTNIAARYLEALETENFTVFPGEPYILGFLRNYGDYLGLDAQELLSLYRVFKIQEQPIPVDQLLHSPSRLPKIMLGILIALLVLGAAGVGVYFFMNRPGKPSPALVTARPVMEYTLSGDILEQRFYQGDSILVPLGEDRYKLTIANLGDIVTITAPNDRIMLDLSQLVSVDINNDGSPELQITLMDFAKNESGAGALLRFELTRAVPVPEAPDPQEAAVSPAAAVSAATTVFSSPSAFPFTLQVSFQGYCMFRYEILFERDRRERKEQYYQRGNEINIQAQNGIRIWASNAQAAKLQVIGGGRTVPLELGGAGEVVVADARWVRDEENRYRLVLARLEQ
ncbi:MAG: helix-turn-helix domain-containing protein [Treponema sp.]|jgi:cytoskeletal protein RodZ|nr:helix-turn-helix domain-containing protein [Treponema sp.]